MTMLVLATDMARHGEIMDGFKEKLELGFDYSKKDHMDSVNLLHIGTYGTLWIVFMC